MSGKPAPTTRFQEKRDAILGAAARLFNQKGVKGGTLADVAQSVGLITNSVTYYYRRKEDLANACYLRSIEVLDQIAAEADALPDWPKRVRAFMLGYFGILQAIAQERHPELVHLHDLRTLSGEQARAVHEAYNAMFRRIRQLLRGDAEGQDIERDRRNAQTRLLLSLVLLGRDWIGRFEPRDYQSAAELACDLMLNGLAAAGSPWAPSRLPDPEPGVQDDAARTREAFLQAATDLVNEHGYQGTSVDAISARLNVTKGSFYHHNENKEDLIAACFERSFEIIRACQAQADARGGNGWHRLSSAISTLVDFQYGPRGPLLRASAWSVLPDELRDEHRRTMGRLAERFAIVIVQGMQDGSIRPVDPAMAARMLIGVVDSAPGLKRWVHHVDAGNASELYARPLLQGLLHAH